MFDLAAQNLSSPPVLFFGLGLLAVLIRSDLAVPESIARFLSLYLLMSIGFRGGAEVAHAGPSVALFAAIGAGVLLSAGLPVLAFTTLRLLPKVSRLDAAAIAAHYGSISAVTFLAVTGALTQAGIAFDGWLVAVAAAMETPAIFAGLLLARAGMKGHDAQPLGVIARDIAGHASIVMLLGAFLVGMIAGQKGMTSLKPFLLDAFPGFLSFFLLDMGLLAGRWLVKGWRTIPVPLAVFAVMMPLAGALIAAVLARLIGLSPGSTAVLITLAASSSYIAVPAAMRLALPEANGALPLTLSLGITFPFNLVVGIPLYIWAAGKLAG